MGMHSRCIFGYKFCRMRLARTALLARASRRTPFNIPHIRTNRGGGARAYNARGQQSQQGESQTKAARTQATTAGGGAAHSFPSPLRTRLLLLLTVESQQSHARDLDNLEPHTRNIAHSVALTAEARDQDLVLQARETRATRAASELWTRRHGAGGGRGGRGALRTFSSIKLRQPSRGTKAAIFLPFLMSWARTHLRMAEFGCLASMPL